MLDLAKYPHMAAMLARNPDRKPVTPSTQPAQGITGRFQHFATDQARIDHLQYVASNNDSLPF